MPLAREWWMASLAGTRRMAADRAAIARLGRIAVIAAAVTVVAGCGSGVQSTVQGRSRHQAGGPVAAPVIKITPATGTRNVRPDRPIRVLAVGGRIVTVAVRTGGRTVAGQLNSQGTEWRSQWALAPGAGYVVQATAKNATGKTVTGTSSFRTLQPANTVSAWLDWTLAANQGRYYGVGLPIILDFSQPVTRK